MAKKSVDHNLMRYSVKEYLLKAGICHLATKVSENVLLMTLKYFSYFAILRKGLQILLAFSMLLATDMLMTPI